MRLLLVASKAGSQHDARRHIVLHQYILIHLLQITLCDAHHMPYPKTRLSSWPSDAGNCYTGDMGASFSMFMGGSYWIYPPPPFFKTVKWPTRDLIVYNTDM